MIWSMEREARFRVLSGQGASIETNSAGGARLGVRSCLSEAGMDCLVGRLYNPCYP
jgi:hypothetical protein